MWTAPSPFRAAAARDAGGSRPWPADRRRPGISCRPFGRRRSHHPHRPRWLCRLLRGTFLAAMGVAFWFGVEQRLIIAVLSVTAALAAFVLANLGGFLLGSLLASVGACLGCDWIERVPSAPASGGDWSVRRLAVFAGLRWLASLWG
ncbi:DUF6114 domain-containing protein [Actinomadura miaoliensis]